MRNPVLLRNIMQLRDRIADTHFKGNRVSVLIDCKSGEFSIPQSIGDLEARMQAERKAMPGSHQFKHAELKILAAEKGPVSFEWAEADWASSLSDEAAHLLREMVDLLNCSGKTANSAREVLLECAEILKKGLPEEITAQSAWAGDLERCPAEKLLSKAAPGTYLLRTGDDYTREIEVNLTGQDSLPVRCFVLTIAESGKKISDRLLIQRPNGWAVYNDDLLLNDYRYETLAEVIAQSGGATPINLKDVA